MYLFGSLILNYRLNKPFEETDNYYGQYDKAQQRQDKLVTGIRISKGCQLGSFGLSPWIHELFCLKPLVYRFLIGSGRENDIRGEDLIDTGCIKPMETGKLHLKSPFVIHNYIDYPVLPTGVTVIG